MWEKAKRSKNYLCLFMQNISASPTLAPQEGPSLNQFKIWGCKPWAFCFVTAEVNESRVMALISDYGAEQSC